MDDNYKNTLTKIGCAIGIPLGIIAGILIATAQPAEAGLFDSMATSGWETRTSDKYKLEAYGFDLRVYEWVSKNDPNTMCTAVFGQTGPTGMQCWKIDPHLTHPEKEAEQ